MSRGIRLLVVVVAIVLLSGVLASWAAAQSNVGPEAKPPVIPRVSGTSPKTHVVQVFTGLWCPPCGGADPGLSRLSDEFGKDLVVLMYHCCQNNNPTGNYYDPYYEPSATDPFDSFYGLKYLPTMIIDGGGAYTDTTLFNIGSSGAAGIYDTNRIDLEDFADQSSNMYLTVTGDISPGVPNNMASVQVSITATDPVVQSNLFVKIVLYEEPLFGVQASGPDVHRYVARAFNEQTLTISQGQTVTKTATFTMNPTWNENKLGVAAYVQSNTKVTIQDGADTYTISDILNSARHDFSPRGIVVHRDRGTVPDYNEIYEVLISTRNDYTFDTWNRYVLGPDNGIFDDHSLPTATELAEYSLLIWHTGPTGTAVLSAADQALIAGYLDGGGSLLITGSDIGFDAWMNYRSWYQAYLHADFESDDTGATSFTGIAGDPISDPFSAQTLNLLGGDGDRVNANTITPGAAVAFQYPGTPPTPAAVRAQHDADSRVVYLGMQYFENTADVMWREAVMGQIINWIDGAAPPQVDVQYPDGGEQFAQGAPVTIRWRANDVVIPEAAIDLYFSENGGTNWQLISGGEPNDGRYAWTVPAIDSSQCRIRVVARDVSMETGDGQDVSASDFVCGDPGFRITFTNADLGWHLLSFPLILTDTTAPAVLSSLVGSYRIARAYDAANAADPWTTYVPGLNGDLVFIDNTMGFWVEITAPGTLTLTGSKPTGIQYVPLKAGWNLVGFPSYKADYTVAQLKADTGATIVQGFDATTGPYFLRDLANTENLANGRGIWVYVLADGLWQVPQ